MKQRVIVGPTMPFKGGVSQHTTQLARRLSSEGADVMLLSWLRQYPKRLYPGTLEPDEPDDEPFLNTEPALSWNRPDSWVQWGFKLRKHPTSNVFVGFTPFQYPICLTMLFVAGKAARRRTVVIAHNVLPHEASRFDTFLTKLLFRSVVGVLTHSPDEQQRAKELGANARYSPLPFHFPGKVWRREPREPTRGLLFLGFVRPYKGLDLLFEAIAQIDPPVRLTVAGEFWEPEGKCVELAERLKISDQVTLRNRYVSTQEMVDLLHQHDALVLPYRSSTGTQLPLIATACGIPCVYSTKIHINGEVNTGRVLSDSEIIDHAREEIKTFYGKKHRSYLQMAQLLRGVALLHRWGEWVSLTIATTPVHTIKTLNVLCDSNYDGKPCPRILRFCDRSPNLSYQWATWKCNPS